MNTLDPLRIACLYYAANPTTRLYDGHFYRSGLQVSVDADLTALAARELTHLTGWTKRRPTNALLVEVKAALRSLTPYLNPDAEGRAAAAASLLSRLAKLPPGITARRALELDPTLGASPKSLGMALRQLKDRVVAGLVLRAAKNRKGLRLWRVE